ncbi:circadian clock-controlled protein daywake-like [Maniola hyperantus]|uniref:circadian clock-controlled protein daywake-like n=1 Tax=Aphantopus hyperantus TaxID=2795564 RepID=UPI0037484006
MGSYYHFITDPLPQKKCSLEDSICLTKHAQGLVHTFVLGAPEHGIKKLDRLHMDDLSVKTPDLFYELWNIRIGGFNNTIIDDLSIYMPFKIIRANFHTTLMVDSDYKLDGLMFGMPVTGEGKCAILLKNVQMEMIFIFDIIKNEHGKDVFDIKKYFYGADAIDGTYNYLGNLYNGDKKKSDAFHKVMNTSWRALVANYGRYFTAKISDDIFEAFKKLMCSRPIEEYAEY